MNIKTAAFIIVFSFILFNNAGCTIRALSDLKVTSINKVNRTDLREIIGDGVSLAEYWTSSDEFLKIELSTKDNFADYIRKHKLYGASVEAGFCDRPKDIAFIAMPDVYVKGKEISFNQWHSSCVPDDKDIFKCERFPCKGNPTEACGTCGHKDGIYFNSEGKEISYRDWSISCIPEEDTFQLNSDGLFVYDIILLTAVDRERYLSGALRENKDQFFYLQYDLKENPADICLNIRGLVTIGLAYKTGEIRIPKAQIQKAIFQDN